MLCTFRVHSDASHLPKPNLTMAKPYIGLSINHLNIVYVATPSNSGGGPGGTNDAGGLFGIATDATVKDE